MRDATAVRNAKGLGAIILKDENGTPKTAIPLPGTEPEAQARMQQGIELIQRLKDEDRDYRNRSAEALGRIGPDVVPALTIAALEDRKPGYETRTFEDCAEAFRTVCLGP